MGVSTRGTGHSRSRKTVSRAEAMPCERRHSERQLASVTGLQTFVSEGLEDTSQGKLASMGKTEDTDIRASPKEQPGNHPSEANSPPVFPTPTPKHPKPRVSSVFFMVQFLHRTLSLQGIRTRGKHLIQKSRRHDQQAKRAVQKLLQKKRKTKAVR